MNLVIEGNNMEDIDLREIKAYLNELEVTIQLLYLDLDTFKHRLTSLKKPLLDTESSSNEDFFTRKKYEQLTEYDLMTGLGKATGFDGEGG